MSYTKDELELTEEEKQIKDDYYKYSQRLHRGKYGYQYDIGVQMGDWMNDPDKVIISIHRKIPSLQKKIRNILVIAIVISLFMCLIYLILMANPYKSADDNNVSATILLISAGSIITISAISIFIIDRIWGSTWYYKRLPKVQEFLKENNLTEDEVEIGGILEKVIYDCYNNKRSCLGNKRNREYRERLKSEGRKYIADDDIKPIGI